MNNEFSQEPPPDPRISHLRVRIKRISESAEIPERISLMKEIFSLRHAAVPLMPEIIQRIKVFSCFPYELRQLICNFKSDLLLKAAQNAGVWFHPDEMSYFLEAGFQEFEQPLLDRVWSTHKGEAMIDFRVVRALGMYARQSETLDTLLVIQENCLSNIKARHAEFERKERDINSFKDHWMGSGENIIFKHYIELCNEVTEAIKILRTRPLSGEVSTDPILIIAEEVESQIELKELIALGESESLEFKSTLRWDLKQEAVSKTLEHIILKTVAAFANTKGGDLLIGVSDNGSILGLKSDYDSLPKTGSDGFELHLRNLLKEQFGMPFVINEIAISFHKVEELDVCQIKTKPTKGSVYLKMKDGNGGQSLEKFYARSGNSTQEIPPSQIEVYKENRAHEP